MAAEFGKCGLDHSSLDSLVFVFWAKKGDPSELTLDQLREHARLLEENSKLPIR